MSTLVLRTYHESKILQFDSESPFYRRLTYCFIVNIPNSAMMCTKGSFGFTPKFSQNQTEGP